MTPTEIMCPICRWMGYDEPMEELEPKASPFGAPIWAKCPVCTLGITYPVATFCINLAQIRRETEGRPPPKGETETQKLSPKILEFLEGLE